jgi:prefoldin subunit 4
MRADAMLFVAWYEQLAPESDANEVEVTWEDQQAINAFSRLNSIYSDVEDALRRSKEQREALDDLALELELADDDQPVLYRIADTFVALPLSDALVRLQRDQAATDTSIQDLSAQLDQYEDQMKQLKVKLYAKFGDNISTSLPASTPLPENRL